MKLKTCIRILAVYTAVLSSSSSAQDAEAKQIVSPSGVPLQPILSKRISVDRFSGKKITSKKEGLAVIEAREANAPRSGEPAPDFSLLTADGDRRVRLHELIKTKPVVLVFGSWGGDVFRESLSGLQELYDRYSKDAHFVLVYVREAHSRDGEGSQNLARVIDATNMEERLKHAQRCREQLRLPFLFVVDEIDDPVATQWSGWPVRAFVVDINSQVIYAGGQGPHGYRPYRGFRHGDGGLYGLDTLFNKRPLEELLERRFPKAQVTGVQAVKP